MAMSLAALFLALQVSPPAKPLDPKDVGALLEGAIAATRSQKSFETSFTAKFTPPEGKSFDYKGGHVGAGSYVLYLDYTESGGGHQRIVRIGDDVWTYVDTVPGWTSAAEFGMDSVARGIFHPLEVLALVAKNRASARLLRPGVCELSLSGDDLKAMLKGHVRTTAVDWKDSSAKLELTIDAGKVKSFTCTASILSKDPQLPGRLGYSADVSFVAYNGATELVFSDEKKRPIPLSAEILTALKLQK